MTSAVALRPVTAGDEAFLREVYGSTRAEELAPIGWTDAQRQTFVAQQFAAQSAHYAQHYPGMTADVVLVDDEPAGRLLVDRREREIRIVDIALLDAFRGRGAGAVLLAALIDEASASGRRLSIHVEQANPARRLYERLGFTPVAEHGAHLLMERAPAVSG